MIKNNILLAMTLSLLTLTASAQFRMKANEEPPMRKLQYAEVAITNLYVDSVDEKKLVEDAIRGMPPLQLSHTQGGEESE